MYYSLITSAKFVGVRYHQHTTRKHGIKFDRLYALRYQLGGKRYEITLGWTSEGWTEEKLNISFADFFEKVYWLSQQHKAKASLVAERALFENRFRLS